MARTSSPARALALLAAAAVLVTAGSADARRRKHKKHRGRPNPRVEHPADAATTPAVRYGALGPDACLDELTRRGVPYVLDTADGVATAVRLTGPLRGVAFHSGAPADQRDTASLEITDCRLALVLDDFAALLARHGVVEVVHYSLYRHGADGDPRPSKHAGGLAIDAGRFVRADGTALSVLDDFHGRIGARPTCGPTARPRRPTDATRALRAILCEAVDARLFHIVLTPNYNRPHRNHFHMELNPGARWFLTH